MAARLGLRWYEGVAIAAIAVGVALNAHVMLSSAPTTVDDLAGHGNAVVPTSTIPVIVAGATEERPEWARELSDQLKVIAGRVEALQQPVAPAPDSVVTPTTTAPLRPRSVPRSPAPATPAPPVVLIDPKIIERPAPEITSQPTTTVPTPTTTTSTTTTPAPEPTYVASH